MLGLGLVLMFMHGDLFWVEAEVGLLIFTGASSAGIFEGDALHAIDPILNSSATPHLSISNLIGDINLVAKSFICCYFSRILRCVTVFAHFLAASIPFCNCHSFILIFTLNSWRRHMGVTPIKVPF
jgi:hypothetical protein